MKKSLALILALLVIPGIGAFGALPDFEMELALIGAADAGEPGPASPAMLLDFSRQGDRWEQVIGIAREYNLGLHVGRVGEATVEEGRIELTLRMKIEGDDWVPGGRAVYHIQLRRAGDGTLEGTHSGTFRGKAVQGRAIGRVKPVLVREERHPAVQPGEHPRILFRKQDLPALRARAQTDFGQRCLEAMSSEQGDGNAIGLGLRWQLTGEAVWAEKARASAERHMANQDEGLFAIGRAWGPRMEQVAVAYDLCYDAWPPAFRKQCEDYLRQITEYVYYDQQKLSTTINWNIPSNYAGPIYSGAAFAGLALWGEKGPEPAQPIPPKTGLSSLLGALTDAADAERSARILVEQKAEYQAALEDWAYEVAEWKRLESADASLTRLHLKGKRMMFLFGRVGMGRGGYQAESGGYFREALHGPNRYHAAYQTMFGYPLSTFEDMSHYLTRVQAATVYAANGRATVQGISASVGFDPPNAAALFPLIPEPWKPAILWAWNLRAGGHPERPDLGRLIAQDPVYTFLHYPLDMKALPPGESGVPLSWQAPDFGFYSTRNAWKDGRDIVFQALARASPPLGWGGPDGGTFRLMGLGGEWASGNQTRHVHRFQESVVVFPENPEFATNREGEVLHAGFRPDGSGEITFDLSGLTLSTEDKAGWPRRERYARIIHPGTAKPGARHLRAFGIDYSGKSGAPMLLVIVDAIEGGKGKLWTWQAPSLDVRTRANGFTLQREQSSLAGHFLSPAETQVALEDKEIQVVSHGESWPFPIRRITATGADPTEGNFFFVATLQEGEAPAVTVQGTGLDAVATVGGQTVRFDGTRVVFGD